MSKPINENLRDVRVENESGDLIPLLDHAGEQFADLIKAIVSTNKAGKCSSGTSLSARTVHSRRPSNPRLTKSRKPPGS